MEVVNSAGLLSKLNPCNLDGVEVAEVVMRPVVGKMIWIGILSAIHLKGIDPMDVVVENWELFAIAP